MIVKKSHYSKEHIKKYALNYLNKFGTSKNYLIKFLVNKIKNRFVVNSASTLQSEVEEIVESLTQMGFLNDVTFCESRIRSLLKEGNSIFNITIRLKQKNINEESINNALNNIIDNSTGSNQSSIQELEEYAMLKYAKKRNLLLWQQSTTENTNNQKAITALMKKGFNFSSIENLLTPNNHLNSCQDSFIEHISTIEAKYNL